MNNFCYAPFISISTDVNGSIRPCCRYAQPDKQKEYTMPNMKDGRIDKLFNGKEFQELRQAFNEGKKPVECYTCWNEESAGVSSFRQMYFKKVKDNFNTKLQNYEPYLIDLKLNNVCNLKCRMCGPSASSMIMKEMESEGVVFKDKDYWLSNKILDTDNEEIFMKWLPNIVDLELTGGEPFVSTENKQLIKKISETEYAKNIKLAITTNGTHWDEDFVECMKKFYFTTVLMSVDDQGQRIEYLRKGSNWNRILKHYKLFKEADLDVYFSTTICSYNIFYVKELHEFCQENDIEWGYDFVHDPIHLNISTLPSFIKEELIEKYSDNVVYNDIVKMLKSDNINAIIAFHKDIKKYDNLRSENFTDIYPEWSEIILYDM